MHGYVWYLLLINLLPWLLYLTLLHKSSSSLTCTPILLVPTPIDDSSQSYNPLATEKKTAWTILLHAIMPIRILAPYSCIVPEYI
ncbi:hypothetical protein EDD85DRAFT_456636 [Armillaria nabsnona]|nr:hypothetical protein EDD85DRAFT_456636 [Armillaria nabsnona]